MNIKNYSLLFVFVFLSSICFGQKYEKVKICELSSVHKVKNFFRLDNLCSFKPETKVLFYCNRGSNLQVWVNDKDLGLCTEDLYFTPKIDDNGNLFLSRRKGNKLFLEVNDVLHGPLIRVSDAMVVKKNTFVHGNDQDRKSVCYYNGKKVFSSKKFIDATIDSLGNYIIITKDIWNKEGTSEIILNGDTLESNIKITDYAIQKYGSIIYFQYNNEKKRDGYFYYLNGVKYGPIDRHGSAFFTQEGQLCATHQKDSISWMYYGDLMVKLEDIYPIGCGDIEQNSPFLLYKKATWEDPHTYIYYDGKESGPFLELGYKSHYFKGGTYSYEEDGISKLGFNGNEIGSAEGKILTGFRNGNQFIYYDEDRNVYVNGKILSEKKGRGSGMAIDREGKYFYDYFDGENHGLIANGTKIPFSKEEPAIKLFSRDFSHYALYNIFTDDDLIIDGKKFPFESGKTAVTYNPIRNSFHWLKVEENEVFWHTYKLD